MIKGPIPLRQKLREVASEAMLDAAERCMLRNDYEQTTMQQIASEAGCAIGTFYLYFKSKEEIFRAILNRHGCEVHALALVAFARPTDPVEKVRKGLECFIRYASNDKGFFRLLLAAAPLRIRHLHKLMDDEARKQHDSYNQLELAALRDAQKRGFIRNDIPAELIQELMESIVITFLEHFLEADAPISVQQRVDTVWKFISQGICANA